MNLDALDKILPINLVDNNLNLYRLKKGSSIFEEKYLIPDFSSLLDQETGIIFHMAYSSALHFHFEIQGAFQEVSYPKYQAGDSLELFIDTQNLEGSKVVHSYSHHFVLFPKPFETISGMEVTRFYIHQEHPLAKSSDFKINNQFSDSGYSLTFDLDQRHLHGFDPDVRKSIRFSYRLNRSKKKPLHFNHSSREYSLEKHPSLWMKMNLV